MAGLIALVGGDEFGPGCLDMDRALLEATGVRQPLVLVLPTAAAREGPARAAANGVEHFSRLGARAAPLMVLNRTQANDPRLTSQVDTADVIYLTGGSPTHLFETLRDSDLLNRLKRAIEGRAVLAGSSAGAMVLGSWMRYRDWSRALGIAGDIAVLPHHERAQPDRVFTDLAASAPEGIAVLGIDAETGCLGLGRQWKVLGAGQVTLYLGDRWERFSVGASLTLGAAT